MNNNNYSSNSNMNNNNYQKPPKTAGNSIDPYGNFQNINNFEGKHSSNTRHNRAHSDSNQRIDHEEEYYQNYNKGNNYSVKNQFTDKYGNEIRKSNTVNGPSSRPKNSPSPLHDPVSVKSDGHYRRDNDSVHSHHRKTSSSGSRQSYERDNRRYDNDYDSDHSGHRYDDEYRGRRRYDDDSSSRRRYDDNESRSRHRYDDNESHSRHRKTSSSGSRPRYDDEDSYGRHRSESSPSSPRPHISPLTSLSGSKKDNYSQPYNSKRPSPLVNAATIKNSNAADDKYRSSKSKASEADSKDSKDSKKKNILPMGIKLKIDARPKKLPPVISNHPTRNSSLKNKK